MYREKTESFSHDGAIYLLKAYFFLVSSISFPSFSGFEDRKLTVDQNRKLKDELLNDQRKPTFSIEAKFRI